MEFPDSILEIIKDNNYVLNKIGMTKAKILIYNDMVLKIENESEESNNEYYMMKLLSSKLPIPKIIFYENRDNINYLLMSKLNGNMANSQMFAYNIRNIIKILANGLKILWNVEINNDFYDNSLDNKLRLASYRVDNNLCSIEDAEPSTYGYNGFLNPRDLLNYLKTNKPNEELVFSHGDLSLSNIFIDNNEISGFIDLGRSGIADKYQDIAICLRSLLHNIKRYNYNAFNRDMIIKIFFEELKLKPDFNKLKYYILLDELF